MKLSARSVAVAIGGIDEEGVRELTRLSLTWETMTPVRLGAAIWAVTEMLQTGSRARGVRQRAEARRRRPQLFAELVLLGAAVESKVPGLTPEAWRRLVRKGLVSRA